MTTQMVIRVDEALKKQTSHLAKQEGKSLSELVRELLTRYAKEHDAETHIDKLWQSMGEKLASKGVTVEDVDEAINQVRSQHD